MLLDGTLEKWGDRAAIAPPEAALGKELSVTFDNDIKDGGGTDTSMYGMAGTELEGDIGNALGEREGGGISRRWGKTRLLGE